MEYLAVALVSLGYQVSYEYARLSKVTPFNLAPLTRNSAVSILSMIGGFFCFIFSIYTGVAIWGWIKGLFLTMLVFPLIWNVLFRISSGGDTLALWVIFAWIGTPTEVYLLLSNKM